MWVCGCISVCILCGCMNVWVCVLPLSHLPSVNTHGSHTLICLLLGPWYSFTHLSLLLRFTTSFLFHSYFNSLRIQQRTNFLTTEWGDFFALYFRSEFLLFLLLSCEKSGSKIQNIENVDRAIKDHNPELPDLVKQNNYTLVWQQMPGIPALWRLEQENPSSRAAWTTNKSLSKVKSNPPSLSINFKRSMPHQYFLY